MQIPLELSFRGLKGTPDLQSQIRRRVDKLERFHSRITGCRVVVERPHEHPTGGHPFRVRIDVTVPPKHEIVVDKRPGDHDLGDDLTTVINNAFEATERQLKELASVQRHEVKTHDEKRALVVRMHTEDDFGFLKTDEGREIYFHRNSLAEPDDWERLAVGAEVRFEETMGDDGPQATTVQLVAKRRERAGEGAEDEDVVEAAEPPRGWREAPETAEASDEAEAAGSSSS